MCTVNLTEIRTEQTFKSKGLRYTRNRIEYRTKLSLLNNTLRISRRLRSVGKQ